MLLQEIFQSLPPAENDKLVDALEAFSKFAMTYATGPTGEDRQKAFYLQIFEKNFRYGFFNRCISVIEEADIDVKNLIPSILWNHCQKYRDDKAMFYPGNGNIAKAM
jgi:hypothetical protein